jgi:transposase, IS30 family
MTHLTIQEREQIMVGFALKLSRRQVAKRINRNPSTVINELNENGKWPHKYNAHKAQQRADKLRRKSKRQRKIDKHPKLMKYVMEKLELKWSPEQISNTLKIKYSNQPSMQISHESIYTYIYILPRGEMRKELISYLRQSVRGRQKRKRGTDSRQGKIPNIISISERPEEVKSRTIPGHWESDLIVGKDHNSALGTIVERTTRTTLLVPLKSKTAPEVRKAFAKKLKTLPRQMIKSMTHDRGKEMSEHELFTKETKIQVYFADPYSPWQRGTNENTNGLIRQYFPKGTDFNTVSKAEILKAQKQLNERPRKTLGWMTPKESFARLLESDAFEV